MARNKGKRGELELAHFLTGHGFPARRGQQFSGSPDSPDLICQDLPYIECKRVEKFTLYPALEKAKLDADGPAVVFHRRNKKPWVVILDAAHFLALIRVSDNDG